MGRPDGTLPPPPYEALRERLIATCDALRASDAPAADALAAAVESWWRAQLEWNGQLGVLLSVHHDINNALVGVRGNAQLLLMHPAGQQSGVRERLEVVLRESGRIKDAANRLHEVKSVMMTPTPSTRAA